MDALGRAKAARKVLRNAIVIGRRRGGKRINLEDFCLLPNLLEKKPPDQFSMASLAVDPNAPAAAPTDHYVSKRVRDAFFRKYCMQSGTVTQTFNGRRRKKC